MERINKDRNPIFYKSAEEMDKPMSELIEELRIEIHKTRGKLHDIKRSYGWDEWIETYEGGLTCMISAMYNFKEELEKFEAKQRVMAEKV
jgi:NifU-like protein involved in Fe-S cluster formation